jgi:hypothetical protein
MCLRVLSILWKGLLDVSPASAGGQHMSVDAFKKGPGNTVKQINKSYGLWFRISFSKFKQKGCPHIHSACLTKLHSRYAVKPPTFLLKVVLLKALDSILAKSCSAVRGYQSGIHSCAEVKQLTLFGHAAHVQIHMSKS